MINLDGMISIPYLKKAVFTGSEKKMNFLLRKQSGDEGDQIQAAIWPGPYIFSVTEEEKKTYREFPFDAEGIEAAVAWLNQQYDGQYRKLEEKEGEKGGAGQPV